MALFASSKAIPAVAPAKPASDIFHREKKGEEAYIRLIGVFLPSKEP